MNELVNCIECGWEGHPDALEADPYSFYEPKTISDYVFCPKCGSSEIDWKGQTNVNET